MAGTALSKPIFRWTLALCLFALFVPAWAQSPDLPPEAKKRRKGEFIFFSNTVVEQPERNVRDFEYVKQFRICLTNGYQNFTGKELKELHAAGSEVFLYLWFNGYYEKELARGNLREEDSHPFPQMVELFRAVHEHPEWLLNPKQPEQGAGAVYPAYFFDFNNPEFRRFYIAFIQRRIRETGYDGIFFDYIGSWALPDSVERLWKAKYPTVTYDDAGVQFLRELRKAAPHVRLFGNQAYRLPAAYYGCLDYDISESHATSFVWGKETRIFVQGKGMQAVRETFYRPWDGVAGYREISRERRERAANQSRVRVYDINYLQPRYTLTGKIEQVEGKTVPVFAESTDRPAIFYGYALAKLTNSDSYASDWYAPGYGKDDIYFLDLGKPLEASFLEKESAVVRYFQNGFVVVTRRAERTIFVPEANRLPTGTTRLWDVYEGKQIAAGSGRPQITIAPAYYPATASSYPSGRVYLYLTGKSANTERSSGDSPGRRKMP